MSATIVTTPKFSISVEEANFSPQKIVDINQQRSIGDIQRYEHHLELVNFLGLKKGIFDQINNFIEGANLHFDPEIIKVELKELEDWAEEAKTRLQLAHQSYIQEPTQTNSEAFLEAKYSWISILAYVWQHSHVLKTPESIENKKGRGKAASELTDMARATLIFDNAITEEILLQTIQIIIEIFMKNDLIINGQSYPWYMKESDIHAKYRGGDSEEEESEGAYSDMTLVFRANVEGITLCFELQINTAEFIEIKKFETKFYEQKKEIAITMNKLIKIMAEYLDKTEDRIEIKVEDIDRLMRVFLKKKLIAENGFTNTTEAIVAIIGWLKAQFKFTKEIDSKKANSIRAMTIFNDSNYLVDGAVEKLSKYAKPFCQSVQAYKNAKGVVNSNKSKQEINKLAINQNQEMLKRGDRFANTKVSRHRGSK